MKLDLTKIKEYIINFIYPSSPICPICKRVLFTDKVHICFHCIDSIKVLEHDKCVICDSVLGDKSGICPHCKSQIYDFKSAYSYTEYDNNSREVVLEFKFHHNRDVAKYVARLIYDDIVKSGIDFRFDIITCVPSKKESFNERGYNQAAIISSELSSLSGLTVNNDLLMVVGTPKDQIGLNFTQRKENVKNKFSVNPAFSADITGKHILIVDDVITTGATLSECAGALKASGAESVSFVAFASASRFYKEREV